MKIKKRSIIIPAFALLIGASLAGSVTGTIAWYQYSTRVQTAYVGTSGGTSGNLQMRIKDYNVPNPTNDGWVTRLTSTQVQAYLTSVSMGNQIEPITAGNVDKDAALGNFYGNPNASYARSDYATTWKLAGQANYIQIPLQLRYIERDGDKEGGAKDDKNIEKAVYLTDLFIEEDATANTTNEKLDLSEAIRFHIDSFAEADRATPANHKNRLLSKNGGTTVTNGKMDLDGDTLIDQTPVGGGKYDFGSGLEDIVYGTGVQTSYRGLDHEDQAGQAYYDAQGNELSDANVYSLIPQTDNTDKDLNILDSSKENGLGDKTIGSTVEDEDEFLNVVITIWVEGWQTFVNSETKHVSVWNSADYIGSKFNVGFEFGVDTKVDA